MRDFSIIWLDALEETLMKGQDVSPRNQLTKEMPQRTIEVNMRKPVLMTPDRKLSYNFMAAEAYWILSGDDTVAGIAPYNTKISDFSDDGVRFFGAYGPKICDQLPYVVAKLEADAMTRQAGLTIWRENPPETKDVPCTIAVFFSIRDTRLNVHVFMRSSDLWLGLPYDVFNFSMLGHLVAGKLNDNLSRKFFVSPGTLYLTAASSHLYERNFDAAHECLLNRRWVTQPVTPDNLWSHSKLLLLYLQKLRDSQARDPIRWWES